MEKIDHKIKLAGKLTEFSFPDGEHCGYAPEDVQERIGAVLLDLGTVARTGDALHKAAEVYRESPCPENWTMLKAVMFLHQNNTGHHILDIDPEDVLLPGSRDTS